MFCLETQLVSGLVPVLALPVGLGERPYCRGVDSASFIAILRQEFVPAWGHLVVPFHVAIRKSANKADRMVQRSNNIGLHGL